MSSRNFNRIFVLSLFAVAMVFVGVSLIGCNENSMNNDAAMTSYDTNHMGMQSDGQNSNMSGNMKACPNGQGCKMNKANMSDSMKACPKGCQCGACKAKMSGGMKACPNNQGCKMNNSNMSGNMKACPKGCQCGACEAKRAAAANLDQESK